MKLDRSIIQGSKEWLDIRRTHIGASDAPILARSCKFKTASGQIKTPNWLWHSKLGLIPDEKETSAMAFGKQMEDPARQLFCEQVGTDFIPAVVFHEELPYMMSSLDGISQDLEAAVEIKTASKEDHITAKNGEVPKHYYAQLQHQMACTGHKEMYYFSYWQGDGEIVVVKRADDFIEWLYGICAEFNGFLQRFEEPPLTEDDYTLMDQEWYDMATKLHRLESKIKEQTKMAKAMKDLLIEGAVGSGCRYNDIVLSRQTRRGAVNYGAIPELSNVDLEAYRKAPVIAWSLKKTSKE